MSVAYYVLREDIPDDCASYVCEDYGYETDYSKGVRLDVTYLYDDDIQAKYPELYADWLDGKNAGTVANELHKVILRARVKEFRDYSPLHENTRRWLAVDDRKQRLNTMLNGLSRLGWVCANHPDWKIVAES